MVQQTELLIDMTKATKTINPLHFEDLEPHRFEDCVRQLIYDFRDWTSLEATGRSGGDDGFDARGTETIAVDSENESQVDGQQILERCWLIQCKREKAITPKKIERYMDECLKDNKNIYGVIFVAPCDLSKKTRDKFFEKIRKYNVKECQIWGKGELEDQLFQPKNDHLLFAYFQISLMVQRRTNKTKIRSSLTIKRKAIKDLGAVNSPGYTPVLIRDSETNSYPYMDLVSNFKERPLWRVYEFSGHYHSGLKFRIGRYFAYLADDDKGYDFAHLWNDAWQDEDIWNKQDRDYELRSKIFEFWNKIPENSKGWLEVEAIIPYEKIVAIDEAGDEYVGRPHVYVPFCGERGPFEGQCVILTTNGHPPREIIPDEKNRMEFFPKKFRNKDDR